MAYKTEYIEQQLTRYLKDYSDEFVMGTGTWVWYADMYHSPQVPVPMTSNTGINS